MSYFVLGSNSFAGSSLVNFLLTQNEKVTGISRSPELHPVMQPYFHNPQKKAYRFHQMDINHQHDELIQLIKKEKPKYIVDLAGQGMVAESWQDPSQWYLTNIVAKAKLHHVLKDCDFLERYVRVSTPEIYGDAQDIMKETNPARPSTPYAVSHAAIDMSVLAYFKQYQFPVMLTRFANFYGPHQQLYRIVPRTMIYAKLGKKLPLHGGGVSERMFIYGDDVANGIFQTIKRGTLGETYHFATKPCVSIRRLVEKMSELLKMPFDSLVEMAEERAGKDSKYEMDAEKAAKELQWQPQFTLEQGLEKTLTWINDNFSVIQQLPLHYIHKP